MRHPVGHEKDMLIRWFITYMTGEQRRQLMGDLPSLYKLLFPEVPDAVIIHQVNQRFEQIKDQRDLIETSHELNL